MTSYEKLKKQPKRFLALTGLTHREFQELLMAFGQAYEELYPARKTLAGKRRKRKAGGGRRSELKSIEAKLLFVLVYQKTYPLQVVQGELFDLSPSRANYWIHRLLPALQRALDKLGVKPERDGRRLARQERQQTDGSDLIIDGTEHRRQRPKQVQKQARHYSGKKKAHRDKNLVVVKRSSKRVAFLSATYAGKHHDKKMADQEQIVYPRQSTLYKDTGFQGYEPHVQQTLQPKKSRAAKNSQRKKSALIASYPEFVSVSSTPSLA